MFRNKPRWGRDQQATRSTGCVGFREFGERHAEEVERRGGEEQSDDDEEVEAVTVVLGKQVAAAAQPTEPKPKKTREARGYTCGCCAVMMTSPPRSLGGTGIPPGRAEAPGNPRASLSGVEDSSKEVGVNLDKLTEEALSLRKKLKDREQTANECITKAKDRLRQTNKRAEAAFSELINRECAEEERVAFVKDLTEDLHDIRARYRKGEPLHMISWDHSKAAIQSKMNRLTSRIEAAGLSPSAIMDELESKEQSTDKEARVCFLELGRRQKELAATERRDGFAGLGGSATTTNTNTCITNANNTNTSSPAVTALLEEKRYIRGRMKECHKLALDVLRFYDRRQTAADDNISRLQQAFVMCNVSHSQDSRRCFRCWMR
eukprot:jgi/Undpi1/4135/HiC_scaffold_16.g07502.m1